MTDPFFAITLAASGLAATGIVASAALVGWRGWLQLKAQELALAAPRGPSADPALPAAGARIEIADLKERIRKLEAIAAGVDL